MPPRSPFFWSANTLQYFLHTTKNDLFCFVHSLQSSYPHFEGKSLSVRRRYNDFVWLMDRLSEEIYSDRGPIPVGPLPPLPPTESALGWFTGGDEACRTCIFWGMGKIECARRPPPPTDIRVCFCCPSERFSESFIEKRRAGLQVWLQTAANHDVCKTSQALLSFLKEDDLRVKSLVVIQQLSAK